MWLLSVLILLPILFLVFGQPLPSSIENLFELVVNDESSPPIQTVALGFLVGVGISSTPLHLFGRYLSTLVHELGHAFTAGLLGGRPQQITISLDRSGLATHLPPENWGRLRATVVSCSGYLAPSIASLAAIRATQLGHPQSWFVYAVATLAIAIIFLVRNFWGLFWTMVAVVSSYFAVRNLPAEWISASVPGIAGYLAIEGLRDGRKQQKVVKYSTGSGCDAEAIALMWRVKPKNVARLQTLVIIGISGFASYLAIKPYYKEILTWLDDFVVTRIREQIDSKL
jgi:hypothetical protein